MARVKYTTFNPEVPSDSCDCRAGHHSSSCQYEGKPRFVHITDLETQQLIASDDEAPISPRRPQLTTPAPEDVIPSIEVQESTPPRLFEMVQYAPSKYKFIFRRWGENREIGLLESLLPVTTPFEPSQAMSTQLAPANSYQVNKARSERPPLRKKQRRVAHQPINDQHGHPRHPLKATKEVLYLEAPIELLIKIGEAPSEIPLEEASEPIKNSSISSDAIAPLKLTNSAVEVGGVEPSQRQEEQEEAGTDVPNWEYIQHIFNYEADYEVENCRAMSVEMRSPTPEEPVSQPGAIQPESTQEEVAEEKGLKTCVPPRMIYVRDVNNLRAYRNGNYQPEDFAKELFDELLDRETADLIFGEYTAETMWFMLTPSQQAKVKDRIYRRLHTQAEETMNDWFSATPEWRRNVLKYDTVNALSRRTTTSMVAASVARGEKGKGEGLVGWEGRPEALQHF
jgi:hypothetical protein